MQNKCSIYCQR